MTPDPFAEHAGARISYSVDGPSDAPTILFINSIGTTRELWSRQTAALADRYRVITYDARGHGRSSVPDGEYTIAQLGGDALAILDAEQVDAAHVCGISLGGITALWLGVHAPTRVRTLTAANTAARIASTQFWTERIAFVKEKGMAPLAEMTMLRWFSDAFRAREPQDVQQFRAMLASCQPTGYLGCCAALRDEDLRDAIAAIRCPVLTIGARLDAATPPEGVQFIHEQIAGSKLVLLDAAHLSNVERADEFTGALAEMLRAQGSGPRPQG
jgi:3-oxoadipate enol-lactonase